MPAPDFDMRIRIDDSELQKLFWDLMKWFTPSEQAAAHREAMVLVERMIEENFQLEGAFVSEDPGRTQFLEGGKWKPLKESTQRQRARLNKSGNATFRPDHPILQRRGTLAGSFDGVQTSTTSWIVGTNETYAAMHQNGGGKYNQVPPRPMVWDFSEDRIDEVLEVYRRRLRKVIDV